MNITELSERLEKLLVHYTKNWYNYMFETERILPQIELIKDDDLSGLFSCMISTTKYNFH